MIQDIELDAHKPHGNFKSFAGSFRSKNIDSYVPNVVVCETSPTKTNENFRLFFLQFLLESNVALLALIGNPSTNMRPITPKCDGPTVIRSFLGFLPVGCSADQGFAPKLLVTLPNVPPVFGLGLDGT